jgi:hypothetical protein
MLFSLLLVITIALYACAEYKWETKPDGTISISEYVGKAKNVIIPESIKGQMVTEIGSGCFFQNSDITSVVMPDTVIGIDTEAFYGCESLTTVTFSKNLKWVGLDILEDCPNIQMPETDNAAALFSWALYKYFSDVYRIDQAPRPSLTIDEHLSILKNYLHPYKDWPVIRPITLGSLFDEESRIKYSINDDFFNNAENDIISSKIADGLGNKPDKKILIIETGFNMKSRINSMAMHFLPLEYIPENVSEVEFIIALVHRVVGTKSFYNAGSVTQTKTDAVLYAKIPSTSIFRKIVTIGTIGTYAGGQFVGEESRIVTNDFNSFAFVFNIETLETFPSVYKNESFIIEAIDFTIMEIKKRQNE